MDSPPPNRVEIDTTRPFESVKEAVALFGEKRNFFQNGICKEVRAVPIMMNTKLTTEGSLGSPKEVEVIHQCPWILNEEIERDKKKSDKIKHELPSTEILEVAIEEPIETLQKELAAAKKLSEAKVFNTKRNPDHPRSEVMEISSAVVLHADLEQARANLKKAIEEGVSLRCVLESVRSELEVARRELSFLKEREADAKIAMATLTEDLMRTKAEVIAAVSAEAKATDFISVLRQYLQQISAESEAAKAEVESLRAELFIAKSAKIEEPIVIETNIEDISDQSKETDQTLQRWTIFNNNNNNNNNIKSMREKMAKEAVKTAVEEELSQWRKKEELHRERVMPKFYIKAASSQTGGKSNGAEKKKTRSLLALVAYFRKN